MYVRQRNACDGCLARCAHEPYDLLRHGRCDSQVVRVLLLTTSRIRPEVEDAVTDSPLPFAI